MRCRCFQPHSKVCFILSSISIDSHISRQFTLLSTVGLSHSAPKVLSDPRRLIVKSHVLKQRTVPFNRTLLTNHVTFLRHNIFRGDYHNIPHRITRNWTISKLLLTLGPYSSYSDSNGRCRGSEIRFSHQNWHNNCRYQLQRWCCTWC